MFSFAKLGLLATLVACLSPVSLGRERWLERDGHPVYLTKRRFGQQNPPVLTDLSTACSDVCPGLAIQGMIPLLAGSPECDQQNFADTIIDASRNQTAAVSAKMILFAQIYRQTEKNTTPDSTQNPPVLRNSVYCQTAPRNSELNGLFQSQDPANDPAKFFDPATLKTVVLGAQPNTFPFGSAGASSVISVLSVSTASSATSTTTASGATTTSSPIANATGASLAATTSTSSSVSSTPSASSSIGNSSSLSSSISASSTVTASTASEILTSPLPASTTTPITSTSATTITEPALISVPTSSASLTLVNSFTVLTYSDFSLTLLSPFFATVDNSAITPTSAQVTPAPSTAQTSSTTTSTPSSFSSSLLGSVTSTNASTTSSSIPTATSTTNSLLESVTSTTMTTTSSTPTATPTSSPVSISTTSAISSTTVDASPSVNDSPAGVSVVTVFITRFASPSGSTPSPVVSSSSSTPSISVTTFGTTFTVFPTPAPSSTSSASPVPTSAALAVPKAAGPPPADFQSFNGTLGGAAPAVNIQNVNDLTTAAPIFATSNVTFTDLQSALDASCKSQLLACLTIVNSGNGANLTVAECADQFSECDALAKTAPGPSP